MSDSRILTDERLAAIRDTIERNSTIGQKMARELLLDRDARIEAATIIKPPGWCVRMNGSVITCSCGKCE